MGKKRRNNRDNVWRDAPPDREPNARWLSYYRAQGIASSEADFQEMLAAFKRPLPASLRINFDCPYADRLKAELKQFCSETASVKDGVEAEKLGAGEPAEETREAVKVLEWFPDGRAFQMRLDRKTIRKSSNPQHKKLHEWLIAHTDSGMLTRQEAVSMIPPCILQVEPHHLTLDMCAAPGSKTTQILEIIQQQQARAAATSDEAVAGDPVGMVVANDSDTQRAYMLVHQCRRITCPALVITTHMGQFMPNLNRHAHRAAKINERSAKREAEDAAASTTLLPNGCSSGSAGDVSSERKLNVQPDGMFDRVLCDVPCSGDGTLRKQPAIVSSWNVSSGLTLYPLQLSIAMRGASLLRVGGLLVYSTCSMNPIENEAVVASLLRRAKGALVLQDASNIIPQLKRRVGLTKWFVMDEAVRPISRKQRKLAEKAARKEKAARERAGAVTAGEGMTAVAAANQAAEDDGRSPANTATPMECEGNTSAIAASGRSQKVDDVTSSISLGEHATNPLVQACLGAGMQIYPTYDDVPEQDRHSSSSTRIDPSARQGRIRPGMFPPAAEATLDGEEPLHLERCIRCMPHDQDTGGFFIALIKKIAPLDPQGAVANAQALVSCTKAQGGGKKSHEIFEDVIEGYDEDDVDVHASVKADLAERVAESTVAVIKNSDEGSTVTDRSEDPPTKRAKVLRDGRKTSSSPSNEYYRPVRPGILADIKTFFGLDERFPFDQLYVRSGEEFPKSICYLTRTIKTNIVDKDIKHDLKVRSLCTFYFIYCHPVSPVEN